MAADDLTVALRRLRAARPKKKRGAYSQTAIVEFLGRAVNLVRSLAPTSAFATLREQAEQFSRTAKVSGELIFMSPRHGKSSLLLNPRGDPVAHLIRLARFAADRKDDDDERKLDPLGCYLLLCISGMTPELENTELSRHLCKGLDTDFWHLSGRICRAASALQRITTAKQSQAKTGKNSQQTATQSQVKTGKNSQQSEKNLPTEQPDTWFHDRPPGESDGYCIQQVDNVEPFLQGNQIDLSMAFPGPKPHPRRLQTKALNKTVWVHKLSGQDYAVYFRSKEQLDNARRRFETYMKSKN